MSPRCACHRGLTGIHFLPKRLAEERKWRELVAEDLDGIDDDPHGPARSHPLDPPALVGPVPDGGRLGVLDLEGGQPHEIQQRQRPDGHGARAQWRN